jgi:GT2 family glycosyltransferase
MDASAPKVSVVIPNRNGVTPRDGLTYLEMVLSSLGEQTFSGFDITVVDDASTDDSVAYLERNWPRVRIVALDQNAGFPGVVNRGIEATTGEHVALLNSDIELSPDWLEQLVDELDGDPEIAFVTGKILSYAERDVIDEAGQDYYTYGRFAPRGQGDRDIGQYDEKRPATIATAAASIYRRAAVAQAGGFDEDYFLYCEDSDLCLRMLLGGYRGVYVPEARAYHVRGGTTGRGSELAQFHVLRNGLITLLKDLPASILWRSLPRIVLYENHQYNIARANGYRRTLFRAYGSFLKTLPSTLRKRRQVQGRRAISAAAFEAFLLTDSPKQDWWRSTRNWISYDFVHPVIRAGGRLLELLPEPIRPKIRTRDRKGRGG